MEKARTAQLEYECVSDEDAQSRKLTELINASMAGNIALPRAHALLGGMFKQVREELQSTADARSRGFGGKYRSWLRALPIEVASVIAIRECMRLCSGIDNRVNVQDLCYNVGKMWELEVRIRQAEVVNNKYMRKIHKQIREHGTKSMGHIRQVYKTAVRRIMQGCIDLELTRTEIIHIGKFGVDACYKSGMIEQVRGVCRSGTSISYKMPPVILDFVMGYTKDDVRNVIHREETRMICEPDPWSKLDDGGYLTARRKSVYPLLDIRRMRRCMRPKIYRGFTAKKMPEVFGALNYLQSTAFELHGPTRDAICRVWNSGGNVMGVPRSVPPEKPEFPLHTDWDKATATPEEMAIFLSWKTSAAAHYDGLRQWRGRVREVGAFMRSVRESLGPFWFPVYVDSRGRVYYRGVPNPQGSDLSKAVLHFRDKKPLGKDGLFWLKVHIANSAGFDEVRMEERCKWTEDNWRAIERALDAPEDSPEIWGDDSPWCMFTACWELREALRSGDPESYCTGVPVHMDATCSGLQHFSALFKDPVGAKYVNLCDPDKIGPKQDIYKRVAAKAVEYIKEDVDHPDHGISEVARWFMKIGVSRDLAKKPVMTYVYSATLKGTAEYLEKTLRDAILPKLGENWLDERLAYRHSMYLARKLFRGIEETVPAAAAAMRWLRSLAREQPNGTRMAWKTPSGFWVQHDYPDHKDTRVQLNSCGVVVTIVREWKDGTCAANMRNAISPNFVHSMDASHLIMTVNAMKELGLSVIGIHDSFGTHPCDVGTMHKCLRESFVKLYSDDGFIKRFMKDINASEEPPEMGDFNIQEVLDSEFMFS